MAHTCRPPPAATAVVKAGAICVLLLLPAAAAQQAIDAEGDGTSRGGGGARNKLVSSIDCQICEATCRVKCLINNLFQWGVCYQRCNSDNCNDWCR